MAFNKYFESPEQAIANVNASPYLTEKQKKEKIGEITTQVYGADTFDVGNFETLLNKLEGSKMRQQRQKSVEGRRDIYQQGLSSMMSNF